MADATKRPPLEGFDIGLLAGLIFGMTQMIASALTGESPLVPLRLFASILLGRSALASDAPSVIAVGVVVHLALSALLGWLYLRLNGRRSRAAQTRWSRQAAVGTGFGALLWLLFFQVIARIAYPWFLDAPQPGQLLMHALFFGLPLGLLYAAFERRVQHVRRAAGTR